MRKINLFLTLLALPLAGFAQKYQIQGKAPKDTPYIYVSNLQAKQKVDSVAVAQDGSFKLEGDAQHKPFAMLYAKDIEMPLILDGNLQVDLQNMSLSGSQENQLLHQAQQAFKPHYQALREASQAVRKLMQEQVQRNDPRFLKAYEHYMEKMNDVAAYTVEVAKAHPHNIFPAHYIAAFGGNLEDEQLVELATASPAAFNTSLLQPLKNKIEALSKRAVGQNFIDLKMPTPTGVVKSLSDFCGKGNYILVDFWASWCGPCRREMPAVKALYEKYKGKGFDIVGVSLDDNKDKWTGAIQALGLPWHHISDLKGWQSAATEAYGISGIPFTVLVAPDGKIVATGLHAEALGEKLREIYGE